jgi:hypothetical protein
MQKIFGFQKLLGELPPPLPLLIVPVPSQFSTQFLKITKNFFRFFKTRGAKPLSPPSRWCRPPLDLPQDDRVWHAKFGRASTYRDRMHKEQTNKQTFFFIYID